MTDQMPLPSEGEMSDGELLRQAERLARSMINMTWVTGIGLQNIRHNARAFLDALQSRRSEGAGEREAVIEALTEMVRDPNLSVEYSPALIAAIRLLKGRALSSPRPQGEDSSLRAR